jgi:PAS domain S-box-containing protein
VSEIYPFLQGGGRMGELIRTTNWFETSFGAPALWPESLKSAVAISLNSGFPIAIYWGPDFSLIYNDAWSSIPGEKHPGALGKPGAQVWPEIWAGLVDEFQTVLRKGESFRRPDSPLYMHRYGYTEECYFDYTLSPIVAANGTVGGVFNAVIETTYRVISERRNKLLQSFLTQAHAAHNFNTAVANVVDLLKNSGADIPFYALYTGTNADAAYQLSAHNGLTANQVIAVNRLVAEKTGYSQPLYISNINSHLAAEPVYGSWPEPVTEALIVPTSSGDAQLKGYMIMGVSSRKRLDDDYRVFLSTIALHTGTLLNNALAYEVNAAYLDEQALNEELATANEELLSTNEELSRTQHTLDQLNVELQERIAKRTEDLAASEQRLKALVMISHYPLMILEGENYLIEVANQQLANLWSKKLDEVTGRRLLDVLPELEGQPFPKLLKRVFTTGESYGQEEEVFYYNTPEGQVTKYVSFYYDPLINNDGKVTGIVVAASDITDMVTTRKLLEDSYEEQQALNEEVAAANEELATTNEELITTNEELNDMKEALERTVNSLTESENRFRNLIREATVGIIVLTGVELTVEIVNSTYSNLIGRRSDELSGQPIFSIIPEAEATFRPLIDQVRTTGKPLYLYDHPYLVYKDGVKIEGFLNLIYQPYREADGTITGVMVLCQEVTEQVVTRQKIEAGEKRFSFILNAIPQQVWTASPDGALTYVNQVVCNDFGYTGEEVVGHGWQKFIHHNDLPGCLRTWQAALKSGKEYQTEFRLLMHDGSYRWHLSRALPFIENNEITLWLGTNTDIEPQKNNEHRKDEFLSIASHELRTPLTSIKAFNQLMRRTTDTGKMDSFLAKSSDHIYRLEKLINDLLDVTRINAGKMSYNMEPFNFAEMLTASVEAVQHTAPQYEINIQRNADVTVTGDRIRLEQVVHNFLTNAVKYSPENKTVLINSIIEEDSIVVSVQDFGIGIAPDHLDKIFDRYYRVDNTAMRFEGLGLGLFISSEILKRHHGSFWIESRQGEGSTFYFRLPLSGQGSTAEPVVKTDQHYADHLITVRYNHEQQRLDADWKGFQTFESVQFGCMRILELLSKNKTYKLFNDNRQVLGTWSEAAEWVGREWFPMAEKEGLQYVAWVLSPSSFSQLSAKKSVDVMQGNVTTQFFTDAADAITWLETK